MEYSNALTKLKYKMLEPIISQLFTLTIQKVIWRVLSELYIVQG